MIIDKQTLKHLTKLSRIEIDDEKEKKILNDLEKILEYFRELEEVDIFDIQPLAGGADLINIYREDKEILDELYKKQGKLIEAFPERGGEFLKVPAVFE